MNEIKIKIEGKEYILKSPNIEKIYLDYIIERDLHILYMRMVESYNNFMFVIPLEHHRAEEFAQLIEQYIYEIGFLKPKNLLYK